MKSNAMVQLRELADTYLASAGLPSIERAQTREAGRCLIVIPRISTPRGMVCPEITFRDAGRSGSARIPVHRDASRRCKRGRRFGNIESFQTLIDRIRAGVA